MLGKMKAHAPVLVLGCVALVLAMTGGAVAAAKITGKDVRNGSLTGVDVKDRSLTKKDFRGSVRGDQGPQGVPGVPGRTGATGPQGPAGSISGTVVVNGPTVLVAPGDVGGADAVCPAGSSPVGTGFFASIGNVGFVERFGAAVGIGVVNDTLVQIEISAQAICAQGVGVSASAASSRDHFRDRLASLRR